jgi:FkbM family methyltransferase
MTTPDDTEQINTIYGRFARESKRRLDLTFDYEAAEIAGFRRVAELVQPTLLLDIGANIGVYAVHLAGIASLKRIIAFEPAPETFRLLERNVALQHDRRLEAVNLALSDQTGRAAFGVFDALAGNNAIRDTAIGGAEPKATINVPTAPLDECVAADGETFLAKIDVEGHEVRVIAGATRFLRANTGVLQVEAFQTVSELEVLLGDLGYNRLFRMKDDYYYSNLPDPEYRAPIQNLLFEETAIALTDLKDERRRRRAAMRAARKLTEQLRYDADPVTNVK